MSETFKPVSVKWFFTYSGSRMARLTRRWTCGTYTHVGLIFHDADGRCVAFEARTKQGFVMYDFAETVDYVHSRGGKLEVSYPLPLSEVEAGIAFGRAVGLAERSTPYGMATIFNHWMHQRYPFIKIRRTIGSVICSEAASWCVSGLGKVKVFANPDAETPHTLRHYSLELFRDSHKGTIGPF